MDSTIIVAIIEFPTTIVTGITRYFIEYNKNYKIL